MQDKPGGEYGPDYDHGILDEADYVVRRLTPTECERLQGFSDGWTDLTGEDPEKIYPLMPQWKDADEDGRKAIERKVRRWCEKCPDGPRYKAIGNSFTTFTVRWIGERMQEVNDILDEDWRTGDGAPRS